MNYQNRDDLYLYFKKIIDGEVEKLADQLQKDVDALKYEAQVSIEEELKEEQDNVIEVAKVELEREYHFKLAKLQREKDLEVMRERRELLNQLFARLEGELLKFREEKAYATWIASRVKKYKLDGCNLIQVDAHDEAVVKVLNNPNIERVEGVIGGFIAYTKDGKNVIDESFKNRINEAKKWFYDHAEWFSDGEVK
ncbi:MAG: hypothetical protein AB7E23_02625 [Bacilli bacterium]